MPPKNKKKQNALEKPHTKSKMSPKNKKKQNASKEPHTKRKYTFDMKRIIEERKNDVEYLRKSAELDAKLKKIEALEEAQNKISTDSVVKCKYTVFDHSKYNLYSKNNSDFDTTLQSQEFLELSIAENEIEANILFISLMNTNWSPVLNDIKNIFHNWGCDLDSILLNKDLIVKRPINDGQKIGSHNFELIINFITHCVSKNNNGYKNEDLLMIAKYIFIVSCDHHYGKFITVIRKLFCTCIETVFIADDETAIIEFAEELYSKYPRKNFSKSIVYLFLPLEGPVIEKMYTYLTFKSFRSLLKQEKSEHLFPSSIKDWFIQDLVDNEYFIKCPEGVLSNIIQLLEHVVFVFDLYTMNEKLEEMVNFLETIITERGIASKPYQLIPILKQWRMQLHRLDVERWKTELDFLNPLVEL